MFPNFVRAIPLTRSTVRHFFEIRPLDYFLGKPFALGAEKIYKKIEDEMKAEQLCCQTNDYCSATNALKLLRKPAGTKKSYMSLKN